MRHTLDALLCQLVLGDVGRQRKTAQDFPLVSDMRYQHDFDVAEFAILELARPLVSDRMAPQHLRKMAFDLLVHVLAQNLAHVLADNVPGVQTEKLGKHLVGETATQVLVPGDGHGRRVVGEQAQLLHALAQGLLRQPARCDVGADAAVAFERTGLVEHRVAADRDKPLGALRA